MSQVPSHLEPEARGGEIAGVGLAFQDAFVVSHIPYWLAHEGFFGLIRESMGDTEVRYYQPGRGVYKELIEVKDHQLTPAEFRSEVARFIRLHEGSPGTWSCFTIVCNGLSPKLAPVINGLERVRGPEPFYELQDRIWANSRDEFRELLHTHGLEPTDAEFLLRHVQVRHDLGAAHKYGQGRFSQAVDEFLPSLNNLSLTQAKKAYCALAVLLRGRFNTPIGRKAVSAAIRDATGREDLFERPLQFYVASCDVPAEHRRDLVFSWQDFFGGVERRYPSPADWDGRLLRELRDTKVWVLEHRENRRISLSGERRLSASLTIGAVFSAVSGFSIDMEHRGDTWSTDSHPGAATPAYEFDTSLELGTGPCLAVAIGVLRDIAEDVRASMPRLGLRGAPLLVLHGEKPVTSADQGNLVASTIKRAISESVQQLKPTEIHMFLAVPSHLALFVGHRLNAVGTVQCYEYVGPGEYVPTCRFDT